MYDGAFMWNSLPENIREISLIIHEENTKEMNV
jgi:hypothetical protein